ncbi:MAG: hypothetical protein ACI4PM_07225 [Butyricicoccus sp.]
MLNAIPNTEEEQTMQDERLQAFLSDGVEFVPQYYLLRVDEPDFGCEGCPEGETACGSVRLVDAEGERTVPIAETVLFATRLDDKMWIGTREGIAGLVSRKGEWMPLNDAEREWLAVLG